MFSLDDFLEKIQGIWYSHQTIYFLSNQKVKNYKKKIIIEKKQKNPSFNFIINSSRNYTVKKNSIFSIQ
uniref:Ycf58 n=1 Tax=Pterocladia lucida TaxID=31408 RepID=A0A6M3WVS5_PTELU|nr:Ycf58 [Pterocladia lucida]